MHHRRDLYITQGVTFVGECLFVEISDEDWWYVLDVGVQFLLLVIVDRLQIVLEELLSNPSHKNGCTFDDL